MKVKTEHIGMRARWNPVKYPNRKKFSDFTILGIPNSSLIDIKLDSGAVYRVSPDDIEFTVEEVLFHRYPRPWTLGESRGSDCSIWSGGAKKGDQTVCSIRGGGIMLGFNAEDLASYICEIVNGLG